MRRAGGPPARLDAAATSTAVRRTRRAAAVAEHRRPVARRRRSPRRGDLRRAGPTRRRGAGGPAGTHLEHRPGDSWRRHPRGVGVRPIADVAGAARPRAPRRGSRGVTVAVGAASRPGLPACSPATRRRGSTRSTRSTSPRPAPAARPAPASTTGAAAAGRSTGATVVGPSAAGGGPRAVLVPRPGRRRRTATGPPCPTPLLLAPAFPGVRAGHGAHGGHPPRPPHGPPPDAAPAAPRGRPRRDPGRGPRAARHGDVRVLGVMDRPRWRRARWPRHRHRPRSRSPGPPGAAGLAELVDPVPFLSELAAGACGRRCSRQDAGRRCRRSRVGDHPPRGVRRIMSRDSWDGQSWRRRCDNVHRVRSMRPSERTAEKVRRARNTVLK